MLGGGDKVELEARLLLGQEKDLQSALKKIDEEIKKLREYIIGQQHDISKEITDLKNLEKVLREIETLAQKSSLQQAEIAKLENLEKELENIEKRLLSDDKHIVRRAQVVLQLLRNLKTLVTDLGQHEQTIEQFVTQEVNAIKTLVDSVMKTVEQRISAQMQRSQEIFNRIHQRLQRMSGALQVK